MDYEKAIEAKLTALKARDIVIEDDIINNPKPFLMKLCTKINELIRNDYLDKIVESIEMFEGLEIELTKDQIIHLIISILNEIDYDLLRNHII